MRICRIVHSHKKGYERDGGYVEVRMRRTLHYSSFAAEALEALNFEDEEGDGEPTIFRVDGTVVPEEAINDLPWTIGRYLKLIQKTPAQLKLGVGYYYQVSMYALLLMCCSRFIILQTKQCSSLPASVCGSSSSTQVKHSSTSASRSSVVFPPGITSNS